MSCKNIDCGNSSRACNPQVASDCVFYKGGTLKDFLDTYLSKFSFKTYYNSLTQGTNRVEVIDTITEIIFVSVNGLIIKPTHYTVNGAEVYFDYNLNAGDEIVIKYI